VDSQLMALLHALAGTVTASEPPAAAAEEDGAATPAVVPAPAPNGSAAPHLEN
jgi:hypothetical protein